MNAARSLAPGGRQQPVAVPKVLLALFEHGTPRVGLERAVGTARRLGAELHVLRVMSDTSQVHPLFPHLNLLNAGRALERTRSAHRRTREWLARELGDAVPVERLRIQCGSFVDQVAQHAHALGPEVIVVPPRDWRLGSMVTQLARASGRPVLVARERSHSDTIFAATDLHDERYRVLQAASQLGQRLGAKVVTFHNVDPLAVISGDTAVLPESARAPLGSYAERERDLARASKELPVRARHLVRSEIDPVQAILEEARSQAADLVVVGTRYRSWWERLLSGSVSSRVVDRASQSVLVTPVGEANAS